MGKKEHIDEAISNLNGLLLDATPDDMIRYYGISVTQRNWGEIHEAIAHIWRKLHAEAQDG